MKFVWKLPSVRFRGVILNMEAINGPDDTWFYFLKSRSLCSCDKVLGTLWDHIFYTLIAQLFAVGLLLDFVKT